MKDQEDFHGDIGLAPAETAKTLKNPKSLKTAGFMPEEDALLEEIISKINERFDGIFSEGDRVIVETLYNRAKENKKLNRQAQKNDEEVYTKSIFPEVFKQVAQDCYIEQMKAFSKLFEDKRFYDTVMATLAQEESRKTSERVKAGQKISRDNGVLYGNGNILGYDRVGDTYVINEEQAETVRMIYDLYLQGYGSMKIAKILTERKRKTASGLIKWSVSNIMRAIKNATYTGTKCYNKSRSNNFLEQKRINNLDMSTYEYVEGDFPSIISQEIWNKAQAIRESRVKPVCVSAGKNTHSKRDSRDIWVNKLRCSCGSSYRKNKWHTKLDGKTSYGYQCYNQLNNGIKRKRAEIGLDTEGYCDSRMITDWKLDFMAKALLEHLWTERKESVLIALDLIKYYYKEEKSNETQSDTVTIQAKLDKANSRLTNLIAMRADGEISKDEYQAMRSPVDEEIKKLQKALDEIPQEKSNPKGLDIEGIRSTLNSFIDFSGSTISHDVVNQFVYLITPTSDTTFDWYVNLNGTADVKATFTAEGRKKNCIIKLEEIEKISSVHREKNEDNAHFIKNPHFFTYLHRLPSRKCERSFERLQSGLKLTNL